MRTIDSRFLPAWLILSSIVGGLLGVGGAWLLFSARIDRLDKDIGLLDDRAASVARLDSQNVKECLDLSALWLDAQRTGRNREAQIYSAHMESNDCAKVMDAIRQVR